MKRILFVAFLFICINSFSQKGWGDIKKLKNTYLNAKSFSCKLSVLVEFADKNQKSKSYNGIVCKSGINYYSEIMGISNLINKKFQIVTNKQFKYIQLSKNTSQTPEKQNLDLETFLDSITQKNCISNLVAKTSSDITYTITSRAKSQISKMIITIGLPEYSLKKVVYYYNEGVTDLKKVTIEYSQIIFNKSIPESYFSENKFVKISGGKVTPSSVYHGYKLYLK